MGLDYRANDLKSEERLLNIKFNQTGTSMSDRGGHVGAFAGRLAD